MSKTRAELDTLLDKLEAYLPILEVDTPAEEVLDAFAGQARVIEGAAGADDMGHVRARLECMLASRGLIPGDNEGEACG